MASSNHGECAGLLIRNETGSIPVTPAKLQYLPSAENCRKGKRDSYNESLAIQWKILIGE